LPPPSPEPERLAKRLNDSHARNFPFIPNLVCSASAKRSGGNGRYQIAPLSSTQSSSGYNALIIDTREGYLWAYWDAPGPDGKFGEGITFLGKLAPGTAPGESIPIPKRFAKPH
jgi:hypothetical protein